MSLFLVALGGGMGAGLRFLFGHLLDGPPHLHWGTLLANLVGSFLLGLLLGHDPGAHAMNLWGVGFCGGLTTYSAFAVQAAQQRPRLGSAYVVITVGGSLAAAWLGLQV